MASNRKIVFWISIVLFLEKNTFAFNLALSEKTAKFIFSSVKLTESNGSLRSEAAGITSNFSSSIKPSYFGYAFTLQEKENGKMGMFVGSPKLINPANLTLQNAGSSLHQTPKGYLQYCDIGKQFKLDQRPSCSPAYPPNPMQGDGFGLSLSVRPNGDSFACSATRELDCGSLKTNPGYCYKSTDFGKTWNVTKRTQYLQCPTMGNVDVLFVLDGSESVGKSNFMKVKSWVKNISKEVGIDDGNVSVGVVQYSYYYPNVDINSQRWIETHIKIGSTRTYAKFETEVDKIDLHGWRTHTGAALRKVATDFKEALNPYRQTTKQVMILLTDGWATDPANVTTNAKQLRKLGIIPYAVGVGRVNESELRIIANGDPTNNTRVYKVDNFEGLNEIANELKTQITGLVLEGGGQQSNKTNNLMNFAEMGLTMAYGSSSRLSTRKRRTLTSNLADEVNMCW